jgi:tetratricopeptide (TPR) repeat protein
MARKLAASTDADTRARGLLDLGNVNDALGDFNAAIGNHNQALKLAVAEKLPRREAEALGNLGSLELAFGRRDEAEVLLKRALVLDEKNGDLKGKPTTSAISATSRSIEVNSTPPRTTSIARWRSTSRSVA